MSRADKTYRSPIGWSSRWLPIGWSFPIGWLPIGWSSPIGCFSPIGWSSPIGFPSHLAQAVVGSQPSCWQSVLFLYPQHSLPLHPLENESHRITGLSLWRGWQIHVHLYTYSRERERQRITGLSLWRGCQIHIHLYMNVYIICVYTHIVLHIYIYTYMYE